MSVWSFALLPLLLLLRITGAGTSARLTRCCWQLWSGERQWGYMLQWMHSWLPAAELTGRWWARHKLHKQAGTGICSHRVIKTSVHCKAGYCHREIWQSVMLFQHCCATLAPWQDVHGQLVCATGTWLPCCCCCCVCPASEHTWPLATMHPVPALQHLPCVWLLSHSFHSTVSLHFLISGGLTSLPCLLLLSVLLLLQAPRNSTTGDHVAPGGEGGWNWEDFCVPLPWQGGPAGGHYAAQVSAATAVSFAALNQRDI